MANLEIQNNDLGSVDLFDTKYEPNTLLLSAAIITATKISEGLILARNTVSGNLEEFVIGGPNGTGTPLGVVGRDEDLPAAPVAGTTEVQISPIISGQVRRERLLTSAADPITDVIVDQLRDYTIIATRVNDVSKLDNQ